MRRETGAFRETEQSMKFYTEREMEPMQKVQSKALIFKI